MGIRLQLLGVLLLLFFSGLQLGFSQRESELRREEKTDYFKKWLEEDVVYIIIDEERAVFRSLTTEDEKEAFVEQFWLRRNPNPGSPENEFQIEHYRRIQYANEWFGSGEAGWKTDRGRVYITFGPPDEITRYQGGQYERPMSEGGGITTTYPFEKWYYRHLKGVGDDIELEFVDASLAGEYRLALGSHEKDALLNVPNVGLTLEESLGLSTKADRVRDLWAGNRQPGPYTSPRQRDTLFERMHRHFAFQRPARIAFEDLKQVVTVSVTYQQIPFAVETHWFHLGEEKFLVPITVKVDNHSLTYRQEFGFQKAAVQLYGSVKDLNRRIVAEFEDTLVSEYTSADFELRLTENSVYQKQLLLEPGLYRLDLVVKDGVSAVMGTHSTRLMVPRLEETRLVLSSPILAGRVEELRSFPDGPELFVIGRLKIIPQVGGGFRRNGGLLFYVQAYHVALDQASGQPSVLVRCLLSDAQGRALKELVDEKGSLVHYFSPARLSLLGGVDLQGLAPGDYRMRLSVKDRVSGQEESVTTPFRVLPDNN